MARRPFASLQGSVAVVALCLSLGAAVLIGSSGSDGLVQAGFEKALATRSVAQSGQPGPAAVPVAQSEDFWLHNGHKHAVEVKPVAWSGQFARGDRLTVNLAGASKVLEVVETNPVSVSTTRLEASSNGPQLIAITCRDVDRPEAPFVRLIITEGVLPGNAATAEKSVM